MERTLRFIMKECVKENVRIAEPGNLIRLMTLAPIILIRRATLCSSSERNV